MFFTPDISMLGYLVGTKMGAFIYNLLHHKGLALALIFAGHFTHHEVILAAGLVLFAYSAFDRMLGYGLKYPDSFKYTHLGWLSEPNKV